ncbi:MAG: PleD family two-component system response regulator [Alphaproteobacteria bacterium]|jgi:two-component system cell cycle response regulator|nr:PleD family two-component system response regulator [Alphaproteobacteria bacterium]
MSARVLVVDDVLPNVKLLEAKLSREYFDVLTASNGPEALEKADAEAPDIVLLDVMMPGMDGFEVCNKLKANPRTRHIPVVMVTALSDVSDRVRGLEAGADDFLTKPVNDVALFARVRSLVRLKMMMDEWRLRETTSGELGVLSSDASEREQSGDAAKVLVVEDNPLDLDKIAQTLTDTGDSVASTETCKQGLDLALGEDFELVVVSLTLLEEDGLRLCSQLRSHDRTRQTPIVLLADDGDIPRVAKGLELGANDYLVKPIDRNELLARVRTQIRRKRYQDRLRSNYEESLSMALTDSLTGLFNRRYLSVHLQRVIGRVAETRKAVSAIMFDIDYFKRVNDTHGHAVGDEVLREVASRVSRNLRNFDMVARYGGEEFVVIMPDAPLESAGLVAERLRQRIETEPFRVSTPAGQLEITISLGVASTEDSGEPPDSLIRRADEALYEAKGQGRNCVVLYGEAAKH